MPEGSPEGWRPPQRESALDGLPPLHDAAPTEQALRDRASAGARRAREDADCRAAEALGVIHLVQSQLVVPAAPPQPTLLVVNPSKSDDQEGPEDEEYLTAVERQLGRKLTRPERATARGLKKEGRSPQEAASRLTPMARVNE
jgi:hypothetical protein